MATKKVRKPTKAELQLDAKLSNLQDSCTIEIRMHSVTQQQERENIAQIYYWWQEAYKIPAYYNAKLAYLPPEQQRNTTDKFNFAPVLRLFYGVYTLSNSKRSRMSSALNAMHEEWEAKPKLYKQDVAKLANFIDQNKGITGLAKQQAKIAPASTPADDIRTEMLLDEYEEKQASIASTDNGYDKYSFQELRRRLGRSVHVEVTDTHRKEALQDEAQDYWRKANGIASFDLDFGVESNKRKYSLALVRVDNDKMEVINTSVEEDIIKAALLSSYRKQFASVPRNLRYVLELLRTQFIGGKIAKQLAKVPEFGVGANGKKIEIRTRVIAIPSKNTLVFSPLDCKSGLVTVSTPAKQMLNVVDSDFYLPGHIKLYLQNRLIANEDCNQFSVSNVGKVMAMHFAPCIAYVMKLENKAMPADFSYVEFVTFHPVDEVHSQVVLNDKYISTIKTKFKFSAGLVQKLAMQYADKWMMLKGDHASRPENDLCTFAVTANAFEFEIFDKADDIGADPVCLHNKKLKLAKPYKHHFKCRDLMVALSGIGALQLVGDVEMLLDGNVLVLKYSTDAASFTTAIPTYSNQTKQRNSSAFSVYQPKLYTEHKATTKYVMPIDEDALIPVYCYA